MQDKRIIARNLYWNRVELRFDCLEFDEEGDEVFAEVDFHEGWLPSGPLALVDQRLLDGDDCREHPASLTARGVMCRLEADPNPDAVQDDLDELVCHEMSARASEINNGGLREQVRFLVDECGWNGRFSGN